MIDLSQLTQEQQWGLAFVAGQRNANKAESEPDWTPEEYALHVLSTACDSYFQSLVEYKKQVTIEKFNAATPDKQQQVFEILEVPDVVN